MGIISKLMIFAVGAGVGFSSMYLRSCNAVDIKQKLNEEIGQRAPVDCAAQYGDQFLSLEETYASISTPGIATPRDISIDYVVGTVPEFKGLVFTDNATGKSGVITKSNVFGQATFGMEYADLSRVMASSPATLHLLPGAATYAETAAGTKKE